MAIEYEKLRAGKDSSDSDSGAEVARKVNENFDKTASALEEVDEKISGFLTEDDLLVLDGNPKQ